MGKKNAWFKHYNTASLGSSFECLRAERNFEVMACYWMLLELISRHETKERRGEVELPKKLVHQYWNVSTHRAHRIMQQLMVHFVKTMRIETLEQSYKLFVSNWSELQENRGGKREPKSDFCPDRGKRVEDRGQKLEGENPSTATVSDFEKLMKRMPIVTREIWVKNYGAEFVEREAALAYAYWIATPGAESWPPMQWISKIGAQLEFAKHRDANAAQAKGSATGGWADIDGVAK